MDVEQRLRELEGRLERLEERENEAHRSAERQRRRDLLVRIALVLVVGISYVAYLLYITGIG